jgi:hypothetical protein
MTIIYELAGRRAARAFAAMSAVVAASALVAGGCTGSSGTVAYAYEDPYVYSTYYPADVAYSSYYYADTWDYNTWYYYYVAPSPVGGDAGVDAGARDAGTADAGATDGGTGGNAVHGVIGAIEALARGQDVCPGHVTVTPKNATPACDDGLTTSERNGATLDFSGCEVGQLTINGTVDLAINRTASEPTCSSSTVISLMATLTVTNLSVARSGGHKLVIPTQTVTGTSSYTFGNPPTSIMANDMGELQVFDQSGTMQNDLTFTGQDTYTLNGNQSYSVDGTTMLHEKNDPSVTATVTKTGLTRSGGCCRPTAGTVVIDRTGGAHPGTTTWGFGPGCGAVTRNGVSVSLPNCIDQ